MKIMFCFLCSTIHVMQSHPFRVDSDHWNGIQYISTCNCGVTQNTRADPFTVREANFEFYLAVGEECGCSRLDRINFPIFQPSTQDYKYFTLNILKSDHVNKIVSCV